MQEVAEKMDFLRLFKIPLWAGPALFDFHRSLYIIVSPCGKILEIIL